MPLRHRSCTSEFAPLLPSPQCHTNTVLYEVRVCAPYYMHACALVHTHFYLS